MSGEKRGLIHRVSGSVILAVFLAFGICSAALAAQWADLVKDELSLQHPRTLRGKAFLNIPLSGATVCIYDRSGLLLQCMDSATGEDGSFSIPLPLPESFTVRIDGGWLNDQPFEHELARTIPHFGGTQPYKVNAVTTLLAAYLDRHPGTSYDAATSAVETYLQIPESVGLDEVIYSSEWYCYYFSHYRFRKAAEAARGMTLFLDQLLDELEDGQTRSFYYGDGIGSSFFSGVLKALLEGALTKIGAEGTGWILGLLDGGGDEDSRISEMEGDLQEILSDLAQIITALQALAQQLSMDTNEVETYIQGQTAQDAISTIKTHYGPEDKDSRGDTNTLKYFSSLRSKDVDPTTKAQIAALVENINGAWDIQDQVQQIHDVIIPDVGNTDGLLDLWTKTFLLQEPVGSDQLMAYYQTLEHYFSILLFYQFKGANLVVESLNYQSVSGTVEPVETALDGDGETPAYSYLTGTFQPMIQEETDRFLANVVKLIAANCGLFWEKNFLPDSARDILARATFFIIQTLGGGVYGGRVGVFGTKNLIDDIKSIGVEELTITHGVTPVKTEVDIPDRPYDYWGTLNTPDLDTLRKGTGYTLSSADVSTYAWSAGGTYAVDYLRGDQFWHSLGELAVKRYTKDYIEDPDGDISYGYLLGSFRIGGKEAVMDPSAFHRDQYTVNTSGDVDSDYSDNLDANGSLALNLEATNRYTNSSTNITQKLEWAHDFTYEGSGSATAYLNIAGNAHGTTYAHIENYEADCKIAVEGGVIDATHQTSPVWFYHSGIPKKLDEDNDWTQSLDAQFSFTLEPGVHYYVFVNIQGEGSNDSGDYDYDVHLDELTHLSVTFVSHEY